ncbi:MAG: hypothetical protein R2711_15775 [Acidimicrobiales bacterium]
MAEGAVEHGLFHQVADAVAGMVDPGLGRLRHAAPVGAQGLVRRRRVPT